MTDAEPDRIAHEAARLIHSEGARDISSAIGLAAERLGLDAAHRPGEGRVRQHLQAMSLQELGDADYEKCRRDRLSIVEQLMTMIEESIDDATTLLVGRAAKGQLDGPGAIHVRVYTTRPLGDVAELLTEHGYDEPNFESAKTRLGRLDRFRMIEDEVELILTRCLPEHRHASEQDLFDGHRIATLDLNALRATLE